MRIAVFEYALERLRELGLIADDFKPQFVDKWKVRKPYEKETDECEGNDSYCGQPRWDRVRGSTTPDGRYTAIYRAGVVSMPNHPAEASDGAGGFILVDVGGFSAVELAIYTIVHESWHRDNPRPPSAPDNPSVEHYANRRGYDAVLVYREWWRRGRPQ